MKQIIYVSVCFFLLISGYSCSNIKNEPGNNLEEIISIPKEPVVHTPLPPPNYRLSRSFKETFFKFFQDDDVYLIKGIALDVYEYGRNIKVIEDLKGNFEGESSIFVWGDGVPSEESGFIGMETNRTGDITLFHENDTLVIFIKEIIRKQEWNIEKEGDYATLIYASSFVQFSDGYVIGPINWWEIETFLWEELFDEWVTFLNSNEMPSWWLMGKTCAPIEFFYNYATNYRLNNCIFIKGVVLESHYEYGIKIQIINDLKGNFPKETSTFIAWGDSMLSSINRFDDLNKYNNGDTLFMLLSVMGDFKYDRIGYYERIEDYTTIPCSYSVLKLSNDSVSGYITSNYWERETMPLDKFQQLINLITHTNQ